MCEVEEMTIDELLTKYDRISCLPMYQAWAAMMFYGKTIENRDRPTKKREAIVIYATATRKGVQESLDMMHSRGIIIPEGLPLYHGALLGVVDIADCSDNTHSDEWVGQWGMPRSFHWYVDNAQQFDQPEPFRSPGQGWFYLTNDLLTESRAKGIDFA